MVNLGFKNGEITDHLLKKKSVWGQYLKGISNLQKN